MTTTEPSDLELIRKTVRELARKYDWDYWREKDKKHEYPWEFVKAFADGGWLGAMIPEEHGGLGLGLTEAGVMMGEIAGSGHRSDQVGQGPLSLIGVGDDPRDRIGVVKGAGVGHGLRQSREYSGPLERIRDGSRQGLGPLVVAGIGHCHSCFAQPLHVLHRVSDVRNGTLDVVSQHRGVLVGAHGSEGLDQQRQRPYADGRIRQGSHGLLGSGPQFSSLLGGSRGSCRLGEFRQRECSLLRVGHVPERSFGPAVPVHRS